MLKEMGFIKADAEVREILSPSPCPINYFLEMNRGGNA